MAVVSQMSPYNSISYPLPQHDGASKSSPHTALQPGSSPSSNSNSITSSPETRPINVRSPIPEEEEDETASETANEPVTPTDTHTYDFRDTSNETLHDSSHTDGSQAQFHQVNSKPPLLIKTAATPPSGATKRQGIITPTVDQAAPTSPSQNRPVSSSQPGIRRGFSGLFRRSNSHMAVPSVESHVLTHGIGGSDTMLSKGGRRMSTTNMSVGNSATTTRSNTPPSPSPSSNDGNLLHPSHTTDQEPKSTQFINSKKNRSSTGLSFRIGGKTWATSRQKSSDHTRDRATSVDLESGPQGATNGEQPLLTRQHLAFAPQSGIGLKARRMSVSLPDDFTVDVVELHKEFSDQSKMFGKRGKTLGKGATSTVALMTRKGGSGELYAVKQFRGKQKDDTEEDYEKKIKSEFSIAKSLHHPNVVETIRLCTDKGKWNHVMEYCQEGDLFNFVQLGYLKADDRQDDRLCLFKQLVQGVQYLHSHGIAHRDIKLENLLITKDSKLKITDFGVAEVFSGIHPGLREAGGECGKEMTEVRLCAPGICGSMPYIAPEVVAKKSEYDPRPLDVWSSAIVMVYMTFGGGLWHVAKEGTENNGTYDDLVRGWAKWEAKHPDGSEPTETDYPYLSPFDQKVRPPALRRILLGMLHPNPAKRSSIEDVANHRWLKNVPCCQVNSYDEPSKVIDASKMEHCLKASFNKTVHHNHLPPKQNHLNKLVRLPGSTDMN